MIVLDRPQTPAAAPAQVMPQPTPAGAQMGAGMPPAPGGDSPYATGLYNQRAPQGGAATLRPGGPMPQPRGGPQSASALIPQPPMQEQPTQGRPQQPQDPMRKFKTDLFRATQLKEIVDTQTARLESLREYMRKKGIPTSIDKQIAADQAASQQMSSTQPQPPAGMGGSGYGQALLGGQ